MRQFNIKREYNSDLKFKGEYLASVYKNHCFGIKTEYILYKTNDDRFVCQRIGVKKTYKLPLAGWYTLTAEHMAIEASDVDEISEFFGGAITKELFEKISDMGVIKC